MVWVVHTHAEPVLPPAPSEQSVSEVQVASSVWVVSEHDPVVTWQSSHVIPSQSSSSPKV
jgi:hypothetical protein